MTIDKDKLTKYWKEAGPLVIFNTVGMTTGRIIDVFNGFIIVKQSTGQKVWINVESIIQIEEPQCFEI